MKYFSIGSAETIIDNTLELIESMLAQMGKMERVLLLPPDFTRFHSGAGDITVILFELLKNKTHIEIMPAIGTHVPMPENEIKKMFPGIPLNIFKEHNWRKDLVSLGEVPGSFVHEVTQGKLDYPIKCEVNRLLVEGKWDRIFSIGQIVPHEVVGDRKP